MNCNKCGCPLGQGAKFCPNCGNPVAPVTAEGYSQNNNVNYQPTYVQQPYPQYIQPKKKNKFPAWAIAVIIVAAFLCAGVVVTTVGFGIYRVVEEIETIETVKAELPKTDLIYDVVDYANNGDIVSLMQAFDTNAGYSVGDIEEQIEDYLPKGADTKSVCFESLKQYITENLTNGYITLDEIGAVDSMKIADIDDDYFYDDYGYAKVTFGITEQNGKYTEVDVYVYFTKIDGKWYIEY